MNIGNGFKNILIVLLVAVVFSVVGVTAATLIKGKEVTYDNTNSKLSSNNVQDAIDELYNLSGKRKKIITAYTYNQTSGASNYCITGDESTCVETTCYENATAGSCAAGTIIDYMVNDNKVVRFHVMYDNGSTMTMQSQKNTVYSIAWYQDNTNTMGPMTVLPVLESKTSNWTNVNKQTYTMGTTVFKTNAYTGCSAYNSCTTNIYTLPERSANARMITVQEAADLGCTRETTKCPIWMYNYMYYSTDNGGTINDIYATNGGANFGYWTMNPWVIHTSGFVSETSLSTNYSGARAVVEINK